MNGLIQYKLRKLKHLSGNLSVQTKYFQDTDRIKFQISDQHIQLTKKKISNLTIEMESTYRVKT